MGTAGAAIATVVGQIIAACIAFAFNARVNKELHFRMKYLLSPRLSYMRQILVVSIPSMVMMMVGSVMNFGMNQILLSFSSTAVAVFGVYYKLQSFVFMPVFGLNNAMVPIVAYNYGAHRRKRIVDTVKLAVLYATGLMLLGVLLFMIVPDLLLSLYNGVGKRCCKSAGPRCALRPSHSSFAGYSIVISSVFQALGNGVYSLIVSVARQILVLLPVAYLLSLSGSLTAVWAAFPIAEVVSVLVSSLLLLRLYRNRIACLPE